MQQWFGQATVNSQTQAALQALTHALLSSDAASVSLLCFLFYIRSGGDLTTLLSVAEGAQKWMYHGGAHQIALAMAAELGPRLC